MSFVKLTYSDPSKCFFGLRLSFDKRVSVLRCLLLNSFLSEVRIGLLVCSCEYSVCCWGKVNLETLKLRFLWLVGVYLEPIELPNSSL